MKQFVLINKGTSGATKFPAFSKEQLKSEIAEPEKYIIREFNELR